VIPDVSHPSFFKIGWLIYNLAHVWHFQHMGWRYLTPLLSETLRPNQRAYDFVGGFSSTNEALFQYREKRGYKLSNFSLQQQANIARAYYEALKRGSDVSAYQPFIEEFRTSNGK